MFNHKVEILRYLSKKEHARSSCARGYTAKNWEHVENDYFSNRYSMHAFFGRTRDLHYTHSSVENFGKR